MKVSMKVDYGVRVLVDLAQRYGQGAVAASEIARRQSIPEPYLDQLLATLRRSGLVKSKRGPQGGHMLARRPELMNLGEVMAVLENPSSPRCMTAPEECDLSTVCVQRDVWQSVEEAARKLLQATTLGQLAELQGRRQEGVTYYI